MHKALSDKLSCMQTSVLIFSMYSAYCISSVIRHSFFSSKQYQTSRSVLEDGSRSLGLFRMGKTCTRAKFHRTDLVGCCHFREGKTRLIAEEIW